MPWPPSANRYWRRVGHRMIVSNEAREYISKIKKMALTWGFKKLLGRIQIEINAFPPDKRKRDLDNIIKITLDSLENAGLFENDSQIDEIIIKRFPLRFGHIDVTVSEIGA